MTDDPGFGFVNFAQRSTKDERQDWIGQCPKCQTSIAFGAYDFLRPHSCPNCGGRYFRCLCVRGDHYILITNDDLIDFSNNCSINCPHPQCDLPLIASGYPAPEICYEKLDIVSWEQDSRQTDFKARAHKRIPKGHIITPQAPRPHPPYFPIQTSAPPSLQDDRVRFDWYHSTTGARLLEAEFYLLHIYRQYGRFSVLKSTLGEDLPEFIRRDLMLRGFVMNIRSSLDTLSQEILLHYEVPIEERRVDFDKVPTSNKLSSSKYKNLPVVVADLFEKFRNQWGYIYLNRLRNALEHRRAQGVVRKIEQPVAIFAGQIVPPTRIEYRLGDDPDSPPGSETYTLHRELCSIGRNLLAIVNEFVLETYDAAQ
jgi:hypothetical protein